MRRASRMKPIERETRQRGKKGTLWWRVGRMGTPARKLREPTGVGAEVGGEFC